MPLYVFLKSPQAHSKEAKEHQINAMLTFSLPLDKQGKWILQNRNTYLHRFIVGGEDFDFYRGRLGIVHRAKIFDKSVNFFAHDEIFIDLKKGDFARNRVYLGARYQAFQLAESTVLLHLPVLQKPRKSKQPPFRNCGYYSSWKSRIFWS